MLVLVVSTAVPALPDWLELAVLQGDGAAETLSCKSVWIYNTSVTDV